MEKRITTPLTLEQVKDLKCGDSVLISGVIYTARDAAHKRLCELCLLYTSDAAAAPKSFAP